MRSGNPQSIADGTRRPIRNARASGNTRARQSERIRNRERREAPRPQSATSPGSAIRNPQSDTEADTISVQIEVPGRLRDGFLAGLLERFLEALRQVVVSRALGFERPLEDRFAARGFLGEQPLRLAQFGL